MSWFGFGGGGKKDDDIEKPISSEFSAPSSFPQQGFDSNPNDFASPSMPPSAGPSRAGNFEQELMMEQQKALITAIMFKLTEVSFDTCVTKPSSSLSSSERSCISSTVGKYLETSEFITAKNSGK